MPASLTVPGSDALQLTEPVNGSGETSAAHHNTGCTVLAIALAWGMLQAHAGSYLEPVQALHTSMMHPCGVIMQNFDSVGMPR